MKGSAVRIRSSALGREAPQMRGFLVPDERQAASSDLPEKEGAAGTFKGGYGFHPLMAYCDETGEALAAILRPGNAGSNTAARQKSSRSCVAPALSARTTISTSAICSPGICSNACSITAI